MSLACGSLMVCRGIIILYTVKKCHLDWFNKKLKGQQIGKIFRVERML